MTKGNGPRGSSRSDEDRGSSKGPSPDAPSPVPSAPGGTAVEEARADDVDEVALPDAPEPAPGLGPTARVDQWLSACRMFRSRTQAALACTDGDVSVNGEPAKPSRPVRAGDEVRARAPRGDVVLVVRAVAHKRLGPVPAKALYEDRTPPPPPEDACARRERGAGRPTKQERRALLRFRHGEG